MKTSHFHAQRRAQLTARAILRSMQERNATRLLVTSVLPGEGKSTLARTLQRELRAAADPWKVEDGRAGSQDIAEFSARCVITDGNSYIAPAAADCLKRSALSDYDASVVVVRRRSTPRTSLTEFVEWLRLFGAPPLAIVWNESVPPGDSLSMLWRALRRRYDGGPARV